MILSEVVQHILTVIDVKCPKFESWEHAENDGKGVLVCEKVSEEQEAPGVPAYICACIVSGMTAPDEDPERKILSTICDAAVQGINSLQNITPLVITYNYSDEAYTFSINFKIAIQE